MQGSPAGVTCVTLPLMKPGASLAPGESAHVTVSAVFTKVQVGGRSEPHQPMDALSRCCAMLCHEAAVNVAVVRSGQMLT